jgi:hypothetical protein
MSEGKRGITRRSFVRTTAGAAALGVLGRSPGLAAEDAAERSRVVLIRRREVLGENSQVDASVLHTMLNEGMMALLEEATPVAAWKRLFGPGDVVGVKSNVWRRLPTPKPLEDAIVKELRGVGVAEGDIGVDDRGVRTNPLFTRATGFVNVRPLRTHHWSGLGTCLKNPIMFVPRPPDYHGDSCAPLGAIWKLPQLEGKIRLNILVMLTPQFHGVGPHSYSKEFIWPYHGLIIGTDPVAVDATGARIIEAKRRLHFGDDRPITPPPHHIEIAETRYGLGVSDPARIDVVRLGWMDDALI